MKKITTILACFALAAASVSAVDFSGGGVLGFGMQDWSLELTSSGSTARIIEADTLFSGGVFIDATYFMVQLNYNILLDVNLQTYVDNVLIDDSSLSVSGKMLTFGLFGKYPLQMGSLTLSPMAGVEYAMLLSMQSNGYDVTDSAKDYFNRLWLKAGVCADFNAGSMFIRPIATIGYGLENKNDKDAKDYYAAADSVSVTPLKYDFAIAFGKKF